jgi:hypothetical protein
MPFTRHDFVETVSVGAASLLAIASARAASAPPAGQTIVNLDDRITFKQQLEHSIDPMVLMSAFWSFPTRSIISWKASKSSLRSCGDTRARSRPSFIAASPVSSLFMNYIVWESVDTFRHGYELPEFQAQLKQSPRAPLSRRVFFKGSPCRVCVLAREPSPRSDFGAPPQTTFVRKGRLPMSALESKATFEKGLVQWRKADIWPNGEVSQDCTTRARRRMLETWRSGALKDYLGISART